MLCKSALCSLAAISSTLSTVSALTPASSPTTTFSTAVSTSTAPVVSAFDLLASDSQNAAVNSQLLRHYGAYGGGLVLNPSGGDHTSSIANFQLEAGTNRLMVDNEYYVWANASNEYYAAVEFDSAANIATFGPYARYCQCEAPARQGQALKCSVEGTSFNTWRVQTQDADALVYLNDPSESAGIDLVDFLVQETF